MYLRLCLPNTMIFITIAVALVVNTLTVTGTKVTPTSEQDPLAKLPGKEGRLTSSWDCSRLQFEIQSAIHAHDWGLSRLKFQQRLKRHPQYIVTIEHVTPTHQPLLELRCPSSPLMPLQIHFHESRFSAKAVRLFDIHSIFPIHTGSMSVKVNLPSLKLFLDRGTDLGSSVAELKWSLPAYSDMATKEHRESESVVELEREIEGVFLKRIQPDVLRQMQRIVRTTTNDFLSNNLLRF